MYFALAGRILGSGFDQVTTHSDKARHFHLLKQKYSRFSWAANITKPHCRGFLVPFIDFNFIFFIVGLYSWKPNFYFGFENENIPSRDALKSGAPAGSLLAQKWYPLLLRGSRAKWKCSQTSDPTPFNHLCLCFLICKSEITFILLVYWVFCHL